MPEWAVALCGTLRGAAGALLGGSGDSSPPPPPPDWGTGGPGLPGSPGNPLTQGQAVVLFRLLREQEHIPFGYAREYCFARAHEMYRIMTEMGIEARKVWNLCDNYDSERGPWDDQGRIIPEGAIRVEHPAQGTILWIYHVAPTVSVVAPQGPLRMVIDPSLFDGPATEAQWRREQDGPRSFWQESGGEEYTPGARDDDYSRTERDLEAARNSSDAWVDGIVPPEDAIVPDEDSEEDPETAETQRPA